MNTILEQPEQLSEHILKALQQHEVINTRASDFKVFRIVEDSINKNYKIVQGDNALLLKLITQGINLPIDRQRVFRLQEELAIIGLAPRPVFLNQEQSIYCEQWLDFESIHQHEQIDALAEALHSLHSAFVSAPKLSLTEHWQAYWKSIKSPTPALCEQYKLMVEQWESYVRDYRDEFVLCHNDLHTRHLSYRNGPLLDWEYAGLGCRYFDIASCCTINEFSHSQQDSLCERYAEYANKDPLDVKQKVQAISEMVNFTYHLWSSSLGLQN